MPQDPSRYTTCFKLGSGTLARARLTGDPDLRHIGVQGLGGVSGNLIPDPEQHSPTWHPSPRKPTPDTKKPNCVGATPKPSIRFSYGTESLHPKPLNPKRIVREPDQETLVLGPL